MQFGEIYLRDTAHSAGAKKGYKFRNKAVNWRYSWWFNTEIHAIVDALGNPVYLELADGNILDTTQATEILSHVDFSGSVILADKAYGSDKIRAYIVAHYGTYNIPPKSNTVKPWVCIWWHHKERHLVECFFQKINFFRRVSTR